MHAARFADPRCRRPVAAVIVVFVAATVAVLTGGRADATCERVPIPGTAFDDVVVCTGEGESADGTVAVSLQGPARASGLLPVAAVSGTSSADQSMVCVSGTGRAGGPHDPDAAAECGASVSGTGADDQGEGASGYLLAVAGTGDARAPVAVSVFGDSHAQLVSISGTGHAGGQTHTDRHPSPFIAVSGCTAEHADPDDPDDTQILTADPARVRVLLDAEAITDPSKPWEPTEITTGEVGHMVQDMTCGTSPPGEGP